MSAENGIEKRSVWLALASQYGMEYDAFKAVVYETLLPNGGKGVTPAQVATFLLVAQQYDLNPFTKEIYAFPTRGGGIQPVVGIDGWLRIVNQNADFDGMDFEDRMNGEGELVAVTCRMYRKSRSHPVEVTEYMAECRRRTDPWKERPARMLRHKATIQAARYAFGLGGIMDPDEAEGMVESGPRSVEAEVISHADLLPSSGGDGGAVDSTTGEIIEAATPTEAI
jgi:phage recombination protein Bet